jgi:hypothetical protein
MRDSRVGEEANQDVACCAAVEEEDGVEDEKAEEAEYEKEEANIELAGK